MAHVARFALLVIAAASLAVGCSEPAEDDGESSAGAASAATPRCEAGKLSLDPGMIGRQNFVSGARVCPEGGRTASFTVTNEGATTGHDAIVTVTVWKKFVTGAANALSKTKLEVLEDAGLETEVSAPKERGERYELTTVVRHLEAAKKPLRFTVHFPAGVTVQGANVELRAAGVPASVCSPQRSGEGRCFAGTCSRTRDEDGYDTGSFCF